jgi:hypothetical protein
VTAAGLDVASAPRRPVVAWTWPAGALDVVYVLAILCALVLGTGTQALLAAPLAASLGVRIRARRRH